MDSISGANEIFQESEEVSNVAVELFHSRQRSIVWRYFTRVTVNGIIKAQCNYCEKFYAGSRDAGTSHLHFHYRTCPKKKERDNEGESSRFSFDQDNARRELANMIIMHEYPTLQAIDILFWWKTSGIVFPTLQAIARDIFAIPVSTVASESSFSAGGRLLSPNRSRLHEDTVEALMCSQSWLWADGGKMSSREYDTVSKDRDMDTST